MTLAIINGIITSIILESIVLSRQTNIKDEIKIALGMSLISMISMEIAMNTVDYLIMGEAKLNLFIIPIMLLVGFLTPLPYNYWRLKALGKACY